MVHCNYVDWNDVPRNLLFFLHQWVQQSSHHDEQSSSRTTGLFSSPWMEQPKQRQATHCSIRICRSIAIGNFNVTTLSLICIHCNCTKPLHNCLENLQRKCLRSYKAHPQLNSYFLKFNPFLFMKTNLKETIDNFNAVKHSLWVSFNNG